MRQQQPEAKQEMRTCALAEREPAWEARLQHQESRLPWKEGEEETPEKTGDSCRAGTLDLGLCSRNRIYQNKINKITMTHTPFLWGPEKLLTSQFIFILNFKKQTNIWTMRSHTPSNRT